MSDLRRLLDPQSIAIVGLSDDPTKHGGRVLSSLRNLGYQGTVWGVNPRRPSVEGVEMVASLTEIDTSPDVVACAIPGEAVPEVIAQAGSVGAGVAIVFAGGFAEFGPEGRQAQQRLIDAATSSGLRILGPNSGGVIRPSANLAVSFLTCLDRPPEQIRPGPVGLVTQSGGTGSYLHNLAADQGGGLGVSISTGNEADLDLADGITALVKLDEIKAIALVLETVRDGASFVTAVEHALRSGKPVVACRIGSSRLGSSMATTHTGALARPAYVLDGILDSLGVTMAETPGELLAVAELMGRAKTPKGDRVGIVTHSGGMAILLTDLAERHGVVLPPPGDTLETRLAPSLDHGVATNPLDMGGIIGGPERFGQVVEAFVDSGEFDSVLAVSTAHPRAHSEQRVKGMLASPICDDVMHLWMAGDVGAGGMDLLRASGRPVTDEPRAAIRAIAGLGRFASVRALGDDIQPANRTTRGETLTEHGSKDVLAAWGLDIPDGGLARSADEAAELADRMGGEVVVKVSSPDIAHKTEFGGVRLGITGGRAAREAYAEVTGNAGMAHPEARIEGARVERHRAGLEVIVGGTDDPIFGPIMVVGLGGIAVEALGPPSIAPAPLDQSAAERMMKRSPGLEGGLARHDSTAVDRLAEMLVLASHRFVEAEVHEFDINPLAWTGERWEALDALVVLAGQRAT